MYVPSRVQVFFILVFIQCLINEAYSCRSSSSPRVIQLAVELTYGKIAADTRWENLWDLIARKPGSTISCIS
jgi:hypothetical protein